MAENTPALEQQQSAPTRDDFERALTRPRYEFAVQCDTTGSQAETGLLLACFVAVICVLSIFSESFPVLIITIILSVLMVGAAVFSIIYYHIASRRSYRCIFDGAGERIIAFDERRKRAVLLDGDTCYIVEGTKVATLDRRAYIDWLDGECAGILAVLDCAEREVAKDENGEPCYMATSMAGGEHRAYLAEDGSLKKIISVQPTLTNRIDPRTGERKAKYTIYKKISVTPVSEWRVPEQIQKAISQGNNAVM